MMQAVRAGLNLIRNLGLAVIVLGIFLAIFVNVRYGAKTPELAKGKTAVEITTPQDLVPTLELIKAAVEAGELDTQMDAASGSLRKGFQR